VVDTPGDRDELETLGLRVVAMSPTVAPALERFTSVDHVDRASVPTVT
jgi:hypothetical protein